jgi:hypothetical protein
MSELAKRAARQIPPELEALFGDPPLIRGEKREDYEKLFSLIATAINPKDSLVWLLAREFTNLSWEIQRERKLKVSIIKFEELKSIAKLLSPARPSVLGMPQPPPTMDKIAKLWSADAETLQVIDNKLAKEGFDASFVMMKALQEIDSQIEAIDRRIENFEWSRMAVLKSISQYSEASARRLAASTEVIEGEYTEAAE